MKMIIESRFSSRFLVQTCDRIGHFSPHKVGSGSGETVFLILSFQDSTRFKINRSISIQTMSIIVMTEEQLRNQNSDRKSWNEKILCEQVQANCCCPTQLSFHTEALSPSQPYSHKHALPTTPHTHSPSQHCSHIFSSLHDRIPTEMDNIEC